MQEERSVRATPWTRLGGVRAEQLLHPIRKGVKEIVAACEAHRQALLKGGCRMDCSCHLTVRMARQRHYPAPAAGLAVPISLPALAVRIAAGADPPHWPPASRNHP